MSYSYTYEYFDDDGSELYDDMSEVFDDEGSDEGIYLMIFRRTLSPKPYIHISINCCCANRL